MASTTTDRRLGIVGSLGIKAPCVTVATSNITLSGLQTISGVTVVEGDRVLVTAQTSSVDNGIYDASTGSWTRSEDCNGSYDVVQGTLVPVATSGGTDVLYRVTSANTITIGSSALTFAIASAATTADQVTYDHGGTSSVPTDVEAKLQEMISVEDYGAVGDGLTDDTDAINNALTAATAGQTVYFGKAGTYLVSASLVDAAVVVPVGVNVSMCRGAWLTKSDDAGSIMAALGSNVLQVNIDGGGYPASGGVGGTWTIENVGIRCYYNASIGLGATDIVIRDSEIKNCNYGIQAYGAQRWRVYGNKIHRIKSSAMLMGYYSGYDSAYNIISGNFFEDCGDYAVAYFQVGGEANGLGVYNTVSNNVAKDCNQATSGYAFGVEQGSATYQKYFLFANNVYVDTVSTGTYGHGGVVLGTCTSSAAIGNVLKGALGSNADYGVNIAGCVGCLVADNVIENFRGAGVSADSSTDCVVRNNVITDCGDASTSYGAVQVAIANTTTGLLVAGNSFRWSDAYAHGGAGHHGICAIVASGKTVSRITIDGNRLHNPPRVGIGAYGLSGNTLDGLTIARNVMTGDALFASSGLVIDYCSTVVVRDNIIRDAGTASTQTNNTSVTISGNEGFATEGGGVTAAISTGATVAHGLVAAPTKVYVTAAESGPTDIYVSAVGATTFVINFGGGGSKTFYWRAEV